MDKYLSSIPLVTDDNLFSYYITDQNTVVISKYLGTESHIIIPETIEDLPVTKVDAEAFMDNFTLNSVSMPSIKIISTNAFKNCIDLTTVHAPNLTQIIDGVFSNCSSLVSIELPSLFYLRYDCFANCSLLENVDLPKILYIPQNTFSYCTNLKNINTPKIKDIGTYAFQYCASFQSIDIPNLEYIDNFAFYNSGVKTVDAPALIGLGYKAFSNCMFLEHLTLSKDLNVVGDDVFESCEINSLTIDYGTENICTVTIDDWNAFASKLTGIDGANIPGKYVKNNLYTKNLVTPSNLIRCTQLVAEVNTGVALKWGIELLNGTLIYISNTLYKWETLHLPLSNLNLPYGTQFKLKAIVEAKADDYSNEILEYVPDCSTVFYEYHSDGPSYRGKINSPLSPPILKCSAVSVHHDAKSLVKYEIRLLATNKSIYTSGIHSNGDNWSKSFSTLNIRPGTQLILHAGVIGGTDSEPYVILEYDPSLSPDTDSALFTYVGNSFYTAILFEGTR